MKKLFLALLIILIVTPAWAEMETTLCLGYHAWTESGHTFKHSQIHDKDFNGLCGQAEATIWSKWLGVYGYGGVDDTVKEGIKPNWDYESWIRYAGIGIKARKQFNKFTVFIGGGATKYKLENRYGNGKSEDWNDYGYEGEIGVNYYLDQHWFLTARERYTHLKVWSDIFKRTSFNPGGSRTWLGIGYAFK